MGLIYWPDKEGGRPEHRRYLDDMPGVALQDVWSDIDPINAKARERLGYPTQKPMALLERIILASSNEGDVVLDPFCGCGTTVDAAQKLHRRWIGIDITYLSVDLMQKRLIDTYKQVPGFRDSFDVHGIPRDVAGAQAMFDANPFEFERWAVSLVDGQSNEKQVGDKGVDGVVRFPVDKNMNLGRVIVSVKGGKQLNPAMVRDLIGTVEAQRAEMGVLITMHPPTPGMTKAAKGSGTFTDPITNRTYPKVQIITVPEMFKGKRPEMPTPIRPYLKAPTFAGWQQSFDELLA